MCPCGPSLPCDRLSFCTDLYWEHVNIIPHQWRNKDSVVVAEHNALYTNVMNFHSQFHILLRMAAKTIQSRSVFKMGLCLQSKCFLKLSIIASVKLQIWSHVVDNTKSRSRAYEPPIMLRGCAMRAIWKVSEHAELFCRPCGHNEVGDFIVYEASGPDGRDLPFTKKRR